MIKTWGKYMGKMHRLTQQYKPTPEIQPRQGWEQDESLAMALRSHDKSDLLPYNRMNELLEWMRSLPREIHCYGLIHTDLHQGNFFVEKGKITAFDFDDSCHHWFSYDLVAPINSIFDNIFEGIPHEKKEKALEIFLGGYRLENSLDPLWVERIEIFDKYRAALIYHWIKTFTKENIFTEKSLEWAKNKLPRLSEALKDPLKLY